MSNVSALQATLDVLTELGRIERVDAALVEAARLMADSLDRDPSNAALWRQYREAIGELTADDADGSVQDAVDDLYAQVRDSAPS